MTVSFHAAKLGPLDRARARATPGELRVAPIGIPDGRAVGARRRADRADGVLELRARGAARGSTKFSSGQVLVVGGSRGLTGAVCMASLAAIRAGAGYATVAVPADLEPIFEVKLTEVMSRGCEGRPGTWRGRGAEQILDAGQRAAAVVLGPGAGRDERLARAGPRAPAAGSGRRS